VGSPHCSLTPPCERLPIAFSVVAEDWARNRKLIFVIGRELPSLTNTALRPLRRDHIVKAAMTAPALHS
jgi:hypothetical protein